MWLCVSNLIMSFSKFTEKEKMEQQLKIERKDFSGKLSVLRQRQALLMRDKKNILTMLLAMI